MCQNYAAAGAEHIFEEGIVAPSKATEHMIRLLNESTVNFVWVVGSLDFGSINEETIVSRFPKNLHFTTKVILAKFNVSHDYITISRIT